MHVCFSTPRNKTQTKVNYSYHLENSFLKTNKNAMYFHSNIFFPYSALHFLLFFPFFYTKTFRGKRGRKKVNKTNFEH